MIADGFRARIQSFGARQPTFFFCIYMLWITCHTVQKLWCRNQRKRYRQNSVSKPILEPRIFCRIRQCHYFFCFPDARVWGKHSAWTSTAKCRRPPRTVPALTPGQYRAEARTHLPFLRKEKVSQKKRNQKYNTKKGDFNWDDYNQNRYLFT